MGLDASVRCNCWEKGLCKPPPVPVFVDDEGWIMMDEDQLDLDEIDFSLIPDPKVHNDPVYAGYQFFTEWLANACEHPHMNMVSKIVSNWSGLRLFQQFVEQVGWRHFPVLQAELPTSNDGFTTSTKAKTMQTELEKLQKSGRRVSNSHLVESRSGTSYWEQIEAYRGVFAFNTTENTEMGLNRRGFFIRDMQTQQMLFQARRFEQRVLETGAQGQPVRVEFINADDESRYIAASGLQIMNGSEYPQLWHVEERETTAKDFAYIIDTLLELCRASVETGNPIRWA